jgi:hypothetical protein
MFCLFTVVFERIAINLDNTMWGIVSLHIPKEIYSQYYKNAMYARFYLDHYL